MHARPAEKKRDGQRHGSLGGAGEDHMAELDESVALLRIRQRAARVHGGLRVESSKLLGALQPLRIEHQLARL